MSRQFIIEPLAARHARENFSCGEPSLDDYIRRYARQSMKRDAGRTYVAVETEAVDICGYCTLSSGSVIFEALPDAGRSGLPRIVPVVHLGRLAVDQSAQGLGLGDALVYHAMRCTLQTADIIGIHALEVWALNERAHSFYRRFGFESLHDDHLHLYLPVQTIRKIVEI